MVQGSASGTLPRRRGHRPAQVQHDQHDHERRLAAGGAGRRSRPARPDSFRRPVGADRALDRPPPRPAGRFGDRPGRSGTAQRGRPAPPRRGRARRGTERDDRGPGPGRDRAGRPGVRRGPPHGHRGRGRRGPDAARDQRRVPQPGPAQPVAAAPGTHGAGRHGAAHDGPGDAGRPLPPRPPHDPHAPPLRRPDHPVRGGTGPRLGATGPDDRRAAGRGRRGRGLLAGVGDQPVPGGAHRAGRGGRHPPARRAHRERHHAVPALHAGARLRRSGGERLRGRD